MDVFGLLLVSTAIAAFGGALYYTTTALAEARSHFPPAFQDESSRYAMDTMVWYRSVPASARRKYFLSLACSSLAAGSTAVLMLVHGQALGAALLGGVFAVLTIATLRRWMKYRHRPR